MSGRWFIRRWWMGMALGVSTDAAKRLVAQAIKLHGLATEPELDPSNPDGPFFDVGHGGRFVRLDPEVLVFDGTVLLEARVDIADGLDLVPRSVRVRRVDLHLHLSAGSEPDESMSIAATGFLENGQRLVLVDQVRRCSIIRPRLKVDRSAVRPRLRILR